MFYSNRISFQFFTGKLKMVGFSSSRVLQVSTAPMPPLSPHLDAVTYNSKGIRRNSRHQQSIRRGKCYVLMTICMTKGQSNINKGSRKVILDVCYLLPHPTHPAALSVRLSNNNLDGCAFAQHCALPVLVVAMCRHRRRRRRKEPRLPRCLLGHPRRL